MNDAWLMRNLERNCALLCAVLQLVASWMLKMRWLFRSELMSFWCMQVVATTHFFFFAWVWYYMRISSSFQKIIVKGGLWHSLQNMSSDSRCLISNSFDFERRTKKTNMTSWHLSPLMWRKSKWTMMKRSKRRQNMAPFDGSHKKRSSYFWTTQPSFHWQWFC